MSRKSRSEQSSSLKGSQTSRAEHPVVRPRFVVVLLGLLLTGLILFPWIRHSNRLHRAKALIANRQLDEAREDLTSLASQQPDSAEVQFQLARVNRKLGRMKDASASIRRALDLGFDKERLELEQSLALAQTGRIAEAETFLREKLAISTEHGAEICEALVNGYLRNYRFGEAAKWIDAWRSDLPDDPQPYVAMGRLYEHLMLWNEAVDAFSEALQRDDARLETRHALGKTLVRLHKYDQARIEFRRCLDAQPENWDAMIGLATCYTATGQSADARSLYEKALQGEPDNVQARFALGQMAIDDGDEESAIELLKDIATQNPRNTSVRYAYATALRGIGKTDEAQAHFDFVTEANEGIAQVQQLTRQIQLKPDMVKPRFQVGVILMKYGSVSEAVAWLMSVLEIDPMHTKSHELLADHFQRSGRAKQAAHHRKLSAEATTHAQ